MMKPYKIRVPNERVHVLIQEKLFRLGFTWAAGQKTVLNDLAKNNYILTASTNIFYSPCIEGYFNTSDSKEISYQDFLDLPEFDVNNCKIDISKLILREIISLKDQLAKQNIAAYGKASNIIRLMWGNDLSNSQEFNPLPHGVLIRNGKTVMVGTEEYFNSLPEKEVTVEQIMQLNNNNQKQQEKIMGEITLNCVREPQNAKNISIGRGYTGILINLDDTQVDSWDEATHFLCTNNKGTEAKYKLSLFERVAPPAQPKITMDQLLERLEVLASRVVIEYNNEEIEVVNIGYENSVSKSSSGCSCGIRSIDELGSLYKYLSGYDYSHMGTIVEDFNEDTLIENLFEKIVISAIEDISGAFALMSTTEDDSEVCEIIDRICEERNGWSTDYLENPNSGNNIKAWLIPVNIAE